MAKLIKGVNDLATLYPDLITEWDYNENGSKNPNDYTPGSTVYINWVCAHGHKWSAKILNRTINKSGCPYCAGSKVITGKNDLCTRNPKLAEQWHPTKNGALMPSDISCKSSKQIWWLGPCGHEWQETVSNRALGYNCPYCAGKRVLVGFNDLLSRFPLIAAEWHSTKNGDVTPNDVTIGSGKEYYWICQNGHEYKKSVQRRTSGEGCPYCAGKKILIGYNDLATKYPELMAEWDYDVNKDLKPTEVTSKSSKKVGWKCCICGNRWVASISNRTSGHGCPCCNNQTSFSEQAIVFYLELAGISTQNRNKEYGCELDVLIPDMRIAIEYDGAIYHKSEKAILNDNKKGAICRENGIRLYHIRENGLPEALNSINIFRKSDSLQALSDCLRELFNELSINIDVDVNRDQFKIMQRYKTAFLEGSLAKLYPDVSLEWHPTKNGTLKPENVTPGSSIKVWWLGKCGHEWQASIASRVKGAGCRICADKRTAQRSTVPSIGGSFGDVHPELIKEWDTSNEKSPFDYKPGSGKYINWVCSKCGYRWSARINDRNRGHGCKYCNNNWVKK